MSFYVSFDRVKIKQVVHHLTTIPCFPGTLQRISIQREFGVESLPQPEVVVIVVVVDVEGQQAAAERPLRRRRQGDSDLCSFFVHILFSLPHSQYIRLVVIPTVLLAVS